MSTYFADDDTLVINDIQVAGAVRIGEGLSGVIESVWDSDAPAGLYRPASDPRVSARGSGTGNLVNLNSFPADVDADILDAGADVSTIDGSGGESIETIIVNGQGGNDDLSAKGGNGTGVTAGQFCLDLGIRRPPVSRSVSRTGSRMTTRRRTSRWTVASGDDHLQGSECGDTLIGGPGVDQIQGNGPNNAAGCRQNESLGQYELRTGGLLGDVDRSERRCGPVRDRVQRQRHDLGHPDAERLRLGCRGRGQARPATTPSSATSTTTGSTVARGDDTLAGNGGNDCVLGQAGNDTLNENAVSLAADGSLVSADTAAQGNGADALDGGPGAEDVIDYSARTTRTVVNLGLISWFNDGADPNFDGVSNECDDVFATTENVLSGLGNDLLSADYINNQSDNEFTDNAGNDQVEGGAGNDVMHIGPLRRARMPTRATPVLDEYDGSATQRRPDRHQRRQLQRRRGRRRRQHLGDRDQQRARGLQRGRQSGEDPLDRRLPARPTGSGDSSAGDRPTSSWFRSSPRRGATSPIRRSERAEPTAGKEATSTSSHALENLTGGSGNDNLTGDDSSNVLIGNAGDDTLTGEGGVDRLDGGDGDDTLSGGAGNDQFLGGAGTNTADFASAPNGVNVSLSQRHGQWRGQRHAGGHRQRERFARCRCDQRQRRAPTCSTVVAVTTR